MQKTPIFCIGLSEPCECLCKILMDAPLRMLLYCWHWGASFTPIILNSDLCFIGLSIAVCTVHFNLTKGAFNSCSVPNQCYQRIIYLALCCCDVTTAVCMTDLCDSVERLFDDHTQLMLLNITVTSRVPVKHIANQGIISKYKNYAKMKDFLLFHDLVTHCQPWLSLCTSNLI